MSKSYRKTKPNRRAGTSIKDPKDFIRTFRGEIINPRAPQVYQIHLSDIAQGLNNVCRFSGQLPARYSVAAHSLAVSKWIEENGGSPLEALVGLLHDATEAYMADLPTAIKRLCKDYKRLETQFWLIIADRFSLPHKMPKIVKIADNAVLGPEKHFQLGWYNIPYAGKDCTKEFIRRFNELGGKL